MCMYAKGKLSQVKSKGLCVKRFLVMHNNPTYHITGSAYSLAHPSPLATKFLGKTFRDKSNTYVYITETEKYECGYHAYLSQGANYFKQSCMTLREAKIKARPDGVAEIIVFCEYSDPVAVGQQCEYDIKNSCIVVKTIKPLKVATSKELELFANGKLTLGSLKAKIKKSKVSP